MSPTTFLLKKRASITYLCYHRRDLISGLKLRSKEIEEMKKDMTEENLVESIMDTFRLIERVQLLEKDVRNFGLYFGHTEINRLSSRIQLLEQVAKTLSREIQQLQEEVRTKQDDLEIPKDTAA